LSKSNLGNSLSISTKNLPDIVPFFILIVASWIFSNFPTADWTMVPNLDDQTTKDEIEMSKTETIMRNKVKEK